MTPHADNTVIRDTTSPKQRPIREPLRNSGSLDGFDRAELTPVIGTEIFGLQVADLLADDEKLRDLAIIISRRGVVIFKNQQITTIQQKLLAQKLGELTGKPSTSKLSKHVVLNRRLYPRLGISIDEPFDDELDVNTSVADRKANPDRWAYPPPLASSLWHSDVAYEQAPTDYTVLHVVTLPPGGSGGDTLWASAYEMYDRISPPMRNMIDGLNAVFTQKVMFERLSQNLNIELNSDRGAPENTGLALESTHPVVRTNPVTGWKSLWATSSAAGKGFIKGVTNPESDMLQKYFRQLLFENHDLQVRYKWNQNDMAIWDNRATFHTATFDYTGYRKIHRVSALAEVPYFDPASKSRREALATEEGSSY